MIDIQPLKNDKRLYTTCTSAKFHVQSSGFSPEIFEGVVAFSGMSSWVVLQMLLKVLHNFK